MRIIGGQAAPAGSGLNGIVRTLLRLPTGDVIAGGDFTQSGTIPTVRLARFTTRPACIADWNCDATAGVDDVFAYLAGWFSGSARFDVDGDLRLSIDDLFVFLNAWFRGC